MTTTPAKMERELQTVARWLSDSDYVWSTRIPPVTDQLVEYLEYEVGLSPSLLPDDLDKYYVVLIDTELEQIVGLTELEYHKACVVQSVIAETE